MSSSTQSKKSAASNSTTPASGVLEVISGGNGFLRSPAYAYQSSPEDVFVPQSTVRRFELRTGDVLVGQAGKAPGRGKSPPLVQLDTVNERPPEEARGRPQFSSLPASYPNERITLECGLERNGGRDYTDRVLDLVVPLGKGQRALIVAPARAGKTMLLQAILHGINCNYPDAQLYVLLVDERPEEVTEMEMLGIGEVVASSFDNPPERHVAVAEMVLESARRQVESGRDVILVLDSLTRLARAYNTTERGSGRTMSGGLDSSALEKPKRFFGSARKVAPNAGGGSLTIIATALVDTGSRMDDVIFEEFKGTGNSEIVLDRDIADRRIYPALDIPKSATRKEELLFTNEELPKIHQIRRALQTLPPIQAMELLLKQVRDTKSNEELLSRL